MGPSGRFYSYIYISSDVNDWDRWFLGRAPRTRETLPDFREFCRVTRHSRLFRRLKGGQRTPENGASHFMCVCCPISFVIVNVNVIFCYSKTCK